MKNDLDQVEALVDDFDFSVNEQCHEFDECGSLDPFIAAGKPVLNAEYLDLYVSDSSAREALCTSANQANLSTLVLPLDLDDSFRYSCQGSDFLIDSGISAPITGLWWDPAEDGWGVTLTQQSDIIFATLFTYDANGNPVWYVASNCVVSGNGCSGLLYEVVGGSNIVNSWDGANRIPTNVGEVEFDFSSGDAGQMDLTIGGVSSTKPIERQVWRTAFSSIKTWM